MLNVQCIHLWCMFCWKIGRRLLSTSLLNDWCMRSLKYPKLKLTVSMVIQIQTITYFSKTLRQDFHSVPTWQDWNAGIAALGRKKHWRAALATAEEMHHRRHGVTFRMASGIRGFCMFGCIYCCSHVLLRLLKLTRSDTPYAAICSLQSFQTKMWGATGQTTCRCAQVMI